MSKIIGISGSLRKDSYNSALLDLAGSMLPDDLKLQIETLHGVPLYDGDLERESGIPKRVEELQETLSAADGLIFASPEYNAGVPGVAKNAIDWLSRGPKKDGVFTDLPVCLIGGGAGGGTRNSQTAWLPTLRMLGARLYSDRSFFAVRVWTLFEDGELTDEPTRNALEGTVTGFASYLNELPRRR